MEWTNAFTRPPHRHSSIARRAMRPRKVETCGEQTVRPIGRRARSQRYRGCRVRIAFSGWRARARAVSEVGLAARELCVRFRVDSTPGRRRHRYARWRTTTDFPNAVHVQTQGSETVSRVIRRTLCEELAEQDAELVVSRYQAEMPGLYLESAGAASPLARCTYVKLLKDRSITPTQQDMMIGRLESCREHEIDSGYLVMLSAPAALAEVCLEAARV